MHARAECGINKPAFYVMFIEKISKLTKEQIAKVVETLEPGKRVSPRLSKNDLIAAAKDAWDRAGNPPLELSFC